MNSKEIRTDFTSNGTRNEDDDEILVMMVFGGGDFSVGVMPK